MGHKKSHGEPKAYVADESPCKVSDDKRCTARRRDGRRCRQPHSNGKVCRYHGAKAGRPPTKGKYTGFVRNKRLRELLEATAEHADRDDQTDRLHLLDGLLAKHLERLGEAGSAELWQQTQKAWREFRHAMKSADEAAIKVKLAELDGLIENGLAEERNEAKVRSIIDQSARVSMVQIRRDYSRATSVSGREIAAFMARIEHGIRTIIKDPAERKALTAFLVDEIGA